MAKYRGRLEIVVDILKVALTGARKTRIMYVANLSYRLLEKYLEEVTQLGFISSDNFLYQVTEKGRNFLDKYDDFSSRYSRIGGEFQRVMFEREALEKLCEPSRSVESKQTVQRRRRG